MRAVEIPRCPRCGYERRGIDPHRRCPECGAPAPSAVDRDASLDRFDRSTIVAVIRTQALVFVVQLLAFSLLAALIVGPGSGGWLLAIGTVAVGASAWLRTSPALAPPLAARDALASWLRIGGPIFGFIATAVGMLAVIMTGGSGLPIAWAVVLPTVAVAVLAARESSTLSAWTRDDAAAGISSMAVGAISLAVVVAVCLLPLAAIVGSSATLANVASGSGIVGLVAMLVRLAVLCWWLMQSIADGRLLFSAILGLLHREQNDRVEDRRFERESAWRDRPVGPRDDDASRDA